MIMRCTNLCVHVFQDKRYGRHKRVFNLMRDDSSIKKARCSVCGKEQTVRE